MIYTLVGGGAHRLLATLRSALHEGVFAEGGEIRLYDLREDRAAAMAAMLAKSPEYRACPVPLRWRLSLPEALEGADAVSVTLLAGSAACLARESALAWAHGFIGSDNISYPGAFLALRGAPILLNVAREMERYCPGAVLLDFANPVGVLSAAVNLFTRIRCYGICEGHQNHAWDLTRILTGEDACDPAYELEVAGVNHASFITKGSLRGRDLFELLDQRFENVPDWAERINFNPKQPEFVRARMLDGLRCLEFLYRRRGALLFSTEGDGFGHYFHEWYCGQHPEWTLGGDGGLSAENLRQLSEDDACGRAEREAADRRFAAFAAREPEDIPWHDPVDHLFFRPARGDVIVRVLLGLAGAQATRVAVSALNRGGVANLADGLSLEFTHSVDREGLHPAAGLEVPLGVYGMTAALATHQTLLARACGSGDPADLHRALLAFPVGADTKAARELWKKLLASSKEYIAPQFQELSAIL